jgi:hypothetical protein
LVTLEWDSDLDFWSGKIKLADGSKAEVYINTPEGDEIITDQARRTFRQIMNSDGKIRQKACDDLLETYNFSWNDDSPLDAETFMQRLTLESITLYPEGNAEIYYADDDMFLGRVIIVRMESDGQLTEATIAG